jgi:hypothetical protein
MSGPVHLRILHFLQGHFSTICASYADEEVSHLERFYRIPLRGRWWPPGGMGFHSHLRARRMVRDLGLTSKDHILVAHPFDGLVLAPLIQKLAGCRFTVLVHDLHADSLARPEIQAGMAAASSVLCVSDALADAVRPFNSQSDVLFPSPGEPMGLAPTFSRKPLALAGGFNDQYLALASKLREPIIAIGENPGGNYPTATFVPRFAENDDAVRFVSTNCSAVVVIVPHGHGEYASHSFPSKLLDFARCGLPMVIIAPQIRRWAGGRLRTNGAFR